jgi:hypothetical protein
MDKRQYESLILRPAEKIFSVVMLFYATGAVMPFIVGEADPWSPTEMKPMEVAVKAALYSVVFCLVAIRWRSVIHSA